MMTVIFLLSQLKGFTKTMMDRVSGKLSLLKLLMRKELSTVDNGT